MKTKYLLAAFVVLGMATCLVCLAEGGEAATPSAEAKGPVAYWSFDEGTGSRVEDTSENGNHGTVANEMRSVKWVDGRSGKALAFTGKQSTRNEKGCVTIPGLGHHDFSTGMTIEGWIKLDPTIVRNGGYEIVSSTVSDRGPGFRFRIAWQALWFGSGEGGAGTTWGGASTPAQTPIKAEVWYHIAGTYDGSVFRVYLDGAEVGASEPNLQLTKGQPTVFIGAYCGGYAYGFEGVIDEVKIYDHARSAVQILTDAKKQ